MRRMIGNALPDMGEVGPRIEGVKVRRYGPSPSVQYAMFTPSSVRAYWIRDASIVAGGWRISIEGEGNG